MRRAGTSISRVHKLPFGSLTTTLCTPGSSSNERYSVNVSPYGFPSIVSSSPPGVVMILMMPYLAFFDFAKTLGDEQTPINNNASRATETNFRSLRMNFTTVYSSVVSGLHPQPAFRSQATAATPVRESVLALNSESASGLIREAYRTSRNRL